MLRVKNLEKFQHYRNRRPPWIKLHRSTLEDYHFRHLPDTAKAHLMLIWVVASGCDNALHDDAQWLTALTGATTPIDIDGLVSAGFIERYEEPKRKRRASNAQAARKQNGVTEGEGEGEGETEKKLLARVSANDADIEPKGTGEVTPADRPVKGKSGKVVETWLTPAQRAWESANGIGSFDIGQAMRELAPLYAKGAGLPPDEIARRLAWYLENRGSESVLPPEHLARKHFTPNLRDFRLRHGKFDPSAPSEAA
jgi:hypothetical protein